MTHRQKQVLEFIRSYVAEHDCSPTLDEIATALVSSKTTVHGHVGRLLDQRLLHQRPGCGTRNLVPADVCCVCGRDLGGRA